MKVIKTFEHEDIQGFKFGKNLFGRPFMLAHIYFIDGLLIDTGHSRMRKEILTTLGQLPVQQIFITHHHEDHSGNIHLLQDHFQCPVYASTLCSEVMKNPPAISFAQWISWGPRPAAANLIPRDQFIDTPNYRFHLIPIPGHAIDMVALYESNKKWLFSADLFVKEYIKIFMREESMKTQIQSIQKILELDFDAILCSHNPQFQGGKEKLAAKLTFLENFYQQAATLYQRGYSINRIFTEMQLKEKWATRILSTGGLSATNMIKSVIRDEEATPSL